MIVGNPDIFAIESEIMQAFDRLSLRALGFFAIHIMGRCYGFRTSGATILATAFDGIERRIAVRGSHNPPFAMDAEAEVVALAYIRSVYAECEDGELFFGMIDSEFSHLVHTSGLVWAPDGEEGFDDGSFVLQFEDEDRVRLIAFHSNENYLIDSGSLRDLWLPNYDFYGILQEWKNRFAEEWEALPKEPAHLSEPHEAVEEPGTTNERSEERRVGKEGR